MIPHYGGVEIGNNVWIGQSTHIARGTIDNTVIGDGCKIDALCHIAHNVVLGPNCSLIAASNVKGSACLGESVYVATATIRDQLVIGKNAFIGMGSVVVKNMPEGTLVAGVPAKPFQKTE